MDSAKFQTVNLGQYICPAIGIKVLVVDGDLTCLAIVSKLLRTLGHEVMTASLASEALSIIEKKKNELHLVLVEVHLPDMEIDDFIDRIIYSSNLSYCFMTAEDYLFSASRALLDGAKLYFKNSTMMTDLCDLWKYANWRNKTRRRACEYLRGLSWHRSKETIAAGHQSLQSAKGKEKEHDIGGGQIESLAEKRKRLTRIENLHKMLLGADKLAGIDEATLNQRHQLIKVPDFPVNDISNPLQTLLDVKYDTQNWQNWVNSRCRQPLKPVVYPIQPHSNRRSCNLNLSSQHPSPIHYDGGKWPLFLNVTNNPSFRRSHQIYLCNCMHVHSLFAPDKFPNLEISSGEMSTLAQDQMQGVARNTSGSVEFMNNGDGEAFVYCMDDPDEQGELDFSTQLADDLCQQFPPPLPILQPLDGKKHRNLGPEAGKVDEIFYSSKEVQQFSDEDLNAWLSRELPNDAVA